MKAWRALAGKGRFGASPECPGRGSVPQPCGRERGRSCREGNARPGGARAARGRSGAHAHGASGGHARGGGAMAGGPPVLLGLRDAAMAGPSPAGPLPAWATNKLGGTADWVPAVRAGPARCARCGRALLLLVQVYCPLERGPAHRALHVFACAAPRCWGAARSWKVLRSQYSQAQEKEPRDLGVKQKEEWNFSAKDWCEDADDWGACDGAEPPACASLELLGLKEAVSSEVECASQLQQLHLCEPADGSGPQDTHPAAREDMDGSGPQDTHPAAREDMVMATAASAPVFQPFYINVVDEEDYMGFLDTHHAHKLLKEYQQRECVDLEQMMSESFAGEDGNEKYEKSEVKSWDHTFHKFMKRISICPEQILRYSWGGQPLFITCPPANLDQDIPACSNCGSSRVFEFQLMPTLVSMLQSDSDLSVEFGTVIVYTCERSCWPTNHQTPLEEFIFVQEDPDQRLFK
ncbi:programmed cell death protein 2-like isoform X2 [Poecile atricapillus]|uniref:programmed cell death protein 2-like isoform X2 n=1 Tax=Poecile atricapillus TaxID=48891 RepID=UPI00273945A3|nr:programmed cell death protein 2-like isoform X2 [Poecile atricapillus]